MTRMKTEDKNKADEIIQTIFTSSKTKGQLKVCGTSVSPAGRKIQTRVTWSEGGKTVIGYVSQYLSTPASALPCAKFPPVTLLQEIFRIRDRIGKWLDTQPSIIQIPKAPRSIPGESRWERLRYIETEVNRILHEKEANGALMYLTPICDKIFQDQEKVRMSDAQLENSREHLKKQARKNLRACLDQILADGLTEEEINEFLKEALVKTIFVTSLFMGFNLVEFIHVYLDCLLSYPY